MRRKHLRSLVVTVALTLVLGLAGPAAAALPADDGGWFGSIGQQLAGWWAALWDGEAPRSASAASETDAYPHIDPDGTKLIEPDDPANTSTMEDGPDTGQGDAAPDIDPNG